MKRGPPQIASRPKRGRPLSFDREVALEKALKLFWTHGYETTSVSELTFAMDVTPPSLYAAFGDKERLFREAVNLYTTRVGGLISKIFSDAATARDAIRSVLLAAADEYTKPTCPPGCFVLTAAMNCSTESTRVQQLLLDLRNNMEALFRKRIEKGKRAGEFTASVHPADLAAFYYTVMRGMSTHARDGANRKKLIAIAEQAMHAWPR